MSDLKETKSQRLERLKREKNAWLHLDEIREFARQGHSSIPPEWLNTYFRTWGIYTQGDGLGVIGGSGGEGKQTPFFMVRLRIPNGLLTSHQLRTIAELSANLGNSVADITVRQNIQLHWVRIESVPELLETLQSIGLTTTGACGDVVRNITGCPLAGVHAHEIADVTPVVTAIDKELGGNPEFYNLPRKFKISVTACPDWCSYPEINDISLIATRRPIRQIASNGHSASATDIPSTIVNSEDFLATHHLPRATSELGFSVRVAGGLSTQPHLAVPLNAFIRWEQAVPVVRAITQVFKDADVLRASRDKARLKYLFLEHGWTAESFLAAVEARLGYQLDPAEPLDPPPNVHRDHLGVIPQRQPGLFTVGASVLRGRTNPTQLSVAANLAEKYGDGHVRLTPMQNLLLINIPESHVATVVHELEKAGLKIETSAFARGTVACTGSEFCKLALTETKSFARWLTEQLEERFPQYQEQLRLHITGCPNSCGQHWIADIGIEGKKIKSNGKMVDAYYFCVGGSVGQIAAIARPVGYRCAATEVPDAIARLLEYFQLERTQNESLQKFLSRLSNDSIRSILAGGPAEASERDLAVAATPHSVEDR
ncbi:MAG TPA: nitrite/sulfite reductase [Candidatus Acidoferrum sp.]|nr:nitrite/sulfite reductase [Candidatus Acidoferrum sp.]